MLPQSHVAYTWLTLSLVQEHLKLAPDADYRWVAVAAVGPDLIDKPLAWAYFYKRYKSAVLFAHTLFAHLGVLWGIDWRFSRYTVYALAFVGHVLLDRLWYFPNTFYWPLRGWHFHVWGKRGAEQTQIGKAYWVTFTRRPELWVWEIGGLLAFVYFVWRHDLHRPAALRRFIATGQVRQRGK